MAEKMIKHLLFTYGREVLNPHYVEGGDQPEYVVSEGLGHLGDVIDITRSYDLERGERLDAFYTDEERKQIEAGSYQGLDSPSVYQARLQKAQQAIQPADGEGAQAGVSEMSTEDVAEHISENKLNVQETIALAGDDPDDIEKVLDAESIATEGEPRAGVTKALEARLAAATTGS